MSPRARAGQAFEDFTGRHPSKVTRARLPDADVTGWEMGPMVGAAYEATRDGETKQYFHQFKKSARPKLVAGDDGKQLYIVGGKYHVTDRGIEDMPALFVVNPSPRSSRAASRSKKPMARRARKRRTSQVAIFRANPVRRRRRRATGRRTIFARNPARRRRRTMRRNPVATMRRNPIRRRRRAVARRTYRRNPSGGAMGIGKMLVPAMGIGAGAVGSEILMGYLPIPAQFRVGIARHITKGVVGVAAGMLIGKVFRQKRIGNFFALGAVAIATHDALKEFIAARWAGVPGLGYGRPVGTPLGYVNPAGVTRFNGAPAGRIGYARPVRAGLGAASTIMDTGGYIGESDFRA